jgi:catechol 2,3-dioxygenase-like lactoylglutathione lyase family enzyme
MHILHHISFGVSDIERAARFYDNVLSPLGYQRVWEDLRPGEGDQAVGYGRAGEGDKFAIKLRISIRLAPGPGFHLAFAASSREAVQAFHAVVLAHGGQDNGAPGQSKPSSTTQPDFLSLHPLSLGIIEALQLHFRRIALPGEFDLPLA